MTNKQLMMTSEQLETLKAAALAATQDVWISVDEDWSDGDQAEITTENRIDGCAIAIAQVSGGGSESELDEPFRSEQQANARYIAAVNPPAILALVNELEASYRREESYRKKWVDELANLQEAGKRIAELESQLQSGFTSEALAQGGMMKNVNFLLFGLCLVTSTALANLNVIADVGGEDASPYFDGINAQGEMPASPTGQPGSGDAQAAMLPVSTPELSPGEVADRPLQLPGIGALFIVGDDDASRSWLQANADGLRSRHAAGLVVNVSNLPALQSLQVLAPGVPMAPASGSELARRLQLSNYPVLITDTGLSQQVTP